MSRNSNRKAADVVETLSPVVVETPVVETPTEVVVETPVLVESNSPAASQPATAILVVQSGKKLGKARASWYELLLQYHGKTLAEFQAAARANPPSTIQKATSNRFGNAETPEYRIRFFVREGILTFLNPAK